MAAPNIVNVSNIVGKSNVANITTVLTDTVTNSASSGKVLKINSMYVANKDIASWKFTLELYSSSRTPTNTSIAFNVPVPGGSTLDVISKSIYLEEGDSLRVAAESNSKLVSVCSFEEIS